MLEAAAQPVTSPVSIGVGLEIGLVKRAGIAHGSERGGEELQLMAVEQHLRQVRGHEEPEMPHAALGDVHGLFQSEPWQQGVEQHHSREVTRMRQRPGEGDRCPDVVPGRDGRSREIQGREQTTHVFDWSSLR
ncbi:hypothetical protein ABZ897_57175 [Nonomuraea sp. NPDC046802]|uniref:hypothetical protein n=1 Tax=Nonomuraea sp. NPDC046802 TaxID=3154919 RepID=UPI003402A6F9